MAQSAHVRLAAHAANPARFHQRVEVVLSRRAQEDGGGLDLRYAIRGPNLDLRVPTPHHPAPADALWRTTCCELFLATLGQAGYLEFNFSPSGQWASLDFIDTRRPAPRNVVLPAPRIEYRRGEDLLQLDVSLPKAALPPGDTLRLAVSAVLEAEGGRFGYWALAHPPGPPDFHHHAGFVVSLGPAGFRPTQWP